ncbi:MAG TPA: amino acid adenylation domain-containing protein [Candidatus Solibacter sp.]|nr:amino acid adenylation domain-containing protein [Candidatus Solibacter sp.]
MPLPPLRRSLVSGFLRSLSADPARTALKLGDLKLTYEQLWEYAGRITACLTDELGPDEKTVAVLADRSVAAYGGILGVLASGRGYVPLNPKFPIERTLHMLQASGCRTLIVGQECAETLHEVASRSQAPLTVITPDPGWQVENLPTHHKTFPARSLAKLADPREPLVKPDDTAYLLFTSGSTGVPKGVAVSQSNAVAYMEYAAKRFGIHGDDRCSQNFDLTFDLSVHDLFTCWDAGAALCPFAEQTLTPATVIDELGLTVWFSVPSVAMFASKLGLLEPGAFPTLRWSLFCGEALSASLAEAWQKAANHSIVENLYGPTEATIAITSYRWDSERSPGECVNGLVPIGWPFDGQQVCVVDENLLPVPNGESGELCLGGSQVTRGYLNDPEKTAKSFVRLAHAGDRVWYRTGDLVRQGERGCFFYLGRGDFQVKVNGYRVELQEIDLVLRDAARTELAVAIPWPLSQGSASGIVGVLSGANATRDKEILAACEARLPRYMVPNRLYHFAQMPLNVNGKIDRGRIAQMLADEKK